MISESKRFLFIHVPKAAGNSLAEHLVAHCREGGGNTGLHNPKNLEGIREVNAYGLHKHATAAAWKRVLGEKAYRAMFKFAVTRNPWDRLVSHYIFKQRKRHQRQSRVWEWNEDHENFGAWLGRAATFDGMCLEDPGWLGRKKGKAGGYETDFNLRFDYLQEDWKSLCSLIQIPYAPLSHRNKGDHRPYRDYYNLKTYRRVAELCAREIEHFGYRF